MSVPKGGQALHEAIQMIIAGNRIDAALYALAHSLAGNIAFAADDIGHARTILANLHTDMLRTIDINWTEIRAMKAEQNHKAGTA